MIHEDSPTASARSLVQQTRATAAHLDFHDRADLLRNLVKAIRDAVKFDPLQGGRAPAGHEWELDGMAAVGDAAEGYYDNAVRAKLQADQQ